MNTSINVLVIGSGGREHALSLKLSESSSCGTVYSLPGNPGMNSFCKQVQCSLDDRERLVDFIITNNIGLVVVGPEQPLVDGLADFLRSKVILTFGPGASAARIESEKSFAKKLMAEYNVPTARYREFTSIEFQDTINYLNNCTYPVVIKADGLAAGKGVKIAESPETAVQTVEQYFVKKIFGESGTKIVVEEFLIGEEVSVFAITDGNDFICLPQAQDHKRIGDGDTGENTGGMGSFAPAKVLSPDLLTQVEKQIIIPTLKGLRERGTPFIGCLYCGLIVTAEGPKVIEFNCRFGDPETQAVMNVISGDFLVLLKSAAEGRINKNAIRYNGGSSVCVTAASAGYPETFQKGYEIRGLDKTLYKETRIYHAGTKEENGKIITNGGRVLGVTSFEPSGDLRKAVSKAYEEIAHIQFENMYFRKDIGARGLK